MPILLSLAKHLGAFVSPRPSTVCLASGPRTVLPRGEASYRAASTHRYPFHAESESESNPFESEFDTVGTLHRSLKDAKHLITATLDLPDSNNVSDRHIEPDPLVPVPD